MQSIHSRRPLSSALLTRASWFVGLLFFSVGCTSVTLDLSDIEEPVMLNSMPYPGVSWAVNELGPFRASVSDAAGGASHPGTSTSARILEDDAQLKAFEAIGGYARRVIGVDNLEVWGGGGNFLVVYAEMASVNVRGRVFEIVDTGEPKEPIEPGEDQ